MQLITFKSKTEFFIKEWTGRKPNTIRKVATDDERLLRLEQWENDLPEDATILVRNADAPSQFFTRQITDISYWAGLWIISWKHQGEDP